jgi:DNA-binding transcriptional LysR family regulator
MKVDFLGLEAFLSVADLGGFRRAGAHLNLSQTAVSHRLRKLEESIGVQLFTRTTRQVTLTRAGSDLLPYARSLLGDFEHQLEVVREKYRDVHDGLAFACTPSIAMHVLQPVFLEFFARNPEAKVRIFDRSTGEVGETVASGLAEFGIAIIAANRWDLATEALLSDDFLLVCRKDHPLAGKKVVTGADLEKQRLIRFTPRTANRIITDEALGTRAERLNWVYEVMHTLTAFMLVRAGTGLAIAPRLALAGLDEAGLCAIPLIRPKITRTVGLLSLRGVPTSPLAQDFQQIFRTHVASMQARS